MRSVFLFDTILFMEQGKARNIQAEMKSSEVREERILRELEKKINILKTLVEVIGSIDIEEDYVKVQEKFNNFLENVHKEYPKAIKDSPQNSDTRFLASLSRGVESLMEKWRKIQEVKDDKQAIFSELGLGEKNVVKKYITPFCIDVIVEKEYFKQKNGKKETARHLTGSPYNIYSDKEDKEELDTDITHERIHAFLEKFLLPFAYPSHLLKNKFTQLTRAKKNGKTEEVERCKKELLFTDPSLIIDLLHEEMVADVDDVKLFLRYHFFDASHKKRMGVGFSTAQDEIDRVTELLEKQAQGEQDEIMRLFYFTFKREVNEKFNRSACIMRKALFLGNHFREDFAVLSLLVLLEPTKFYHIETFLKSRVDRESYEGYSAFYEVAGEDKLSLKSLRFLLQIKDKLHKKHRFILKTAITTISDRGGYLAIDDIRGLKDLHSYNQGLAEFGEFLDIEKKVIKYHQTIASRMFFYHWLRDEVRNDFNELPRLIENLHKKDKVSLLAELEELFSGDIQQYLKSKFGEEGVTEKFIKGLPLWEVLAELKLDKVAQLGLDAYQKNVTSLPDA